MLNLNWGNFVAALPQILLTLVICSYHWIVDQLKFFFPKAFYKSVDNEIVCITGGGSGIGRMMSLKLAKLGATIVTVDINSRGNEETVKLIKNEGGKAFAYTCDIGNREEVYKLAQRIKNEVGVPYLLINNAGIVSGRELLGTPDEKVELTFRVNILAHFWTVKAFLPDMIKAKKGHIVNVASLAGLVGSAKLVDYCSSKSAAVGMDESLRAELFAQGHREYIKTTVICPYYINTGMFDGTKSKILKILDPEYVAQKSVDAIMTDTEIILIPGWISILLTLKAVLPPPGFVYLSEVFGLTTAMDEFVGRSNVKKER